MIRRFWMVAAAFLVASAPLAAQQRGWTPPKTPWGDPDLQGTWTSDNAIGVPFQRPAEFGTREQLTDEEYAARARANTEQIAKDESNFPETPFAQDTASNNAPRHWLERAVAPSRQTSLVVDPPDGRIPPLTAEGQQRAATRFAARSAREPADAPEDRSYYDRCITRGVTGSILPAIYGNGTEILQGPGVVVIRNEMIHENRVIPLDPSTGSGLPRAQSRGDGRPHVGSRIRMYMGDSRGRFEGETLVVETTNFTDRLSIGFGGTSSLALRLIERFTRAGPDTLHYEFTVDDPGTYTRPWTVALDLNTRPGYRIYEYACHEGNYGLRNMLSAARAEEAR